MDENEELARAICTSAGIDPDTKIIMGEPCRVGGYARHAYYLYEDQIVPAWRLFWSDAYQAMRVVRARTTAAKDAT